MPQPKKDFYFKFLRSKAKTKLTNGPKKERRAKRKLNKFLKKLRLKPTS